MVDPTKITNFHRSQEELEELILFCISVAGKSAKTISRALDMFFQELKTCLNIEDKGPFYIIKKAKSKNILYQKIIESSLGQHYKLYRSYNEISKSNIDLKSCTTEDLEKFYGIGPKTSRFFILHTRKHQRLAVLDTHILKWLRMLGHDAPSSTPGSMKIYKSLESIFLKEADKRLKTPEELDLEIWNAFSGNTKNQLADL